jgi:malate synthase
MIRSDILQKFPDLFGAKKVNGRDVNVEEAITALTRELRPAIAVARPGTGKVRMAKMGS